MISWGCLFYLSDFSESHHYFQKLSKTFRPFQNFQTLSDPFRNFQTLSEEVWKSLVEAINVMIKIFLWAILIKVLEILWTYGTDFGESSWCTWDLQWGTFSKMPKSSSVVMVLANWVLSQDLPNHGMCAQGVEIWQVELENGACFYWV